MLRISGTVFRLDGRRGRREKALGDDDGGALAGFVLDGFESAVGVGEREGLDSGTEIKVVSEGKKVARVLARHVSDTAQLALAQEQAVVVEGGHLVEVNGVDGDDSALAQSGECADDHLAAGSEGDGAVELDGRLASSSPTHLAPSEAAARRCGSPRVTT